MLQPKKTKYRKAFKGRIHGSAKGGFSLNFGSYGLKAMEPERIFLQGVPRQRTTTSRPMSSVGAAMVIFEVEM